MKLAVLLIPLAFVAITINPVLTQNSENTTDEWSMQRYDPQRTGFTPAKISSDLELRWLFKTSAEVWTTPAVINGRVYVGAGGWGPGWFYCLNAENGQSLWEFEAPNTVSSPIVRNNRVYFGDFDNFYCLDAENGSIIWAFRGVDTSPITDQLRLGDDFRSPTLTDNKIYVASSSYSYVHCLSAENGEIIWQRENLGYRASPAVAYGKVFVGGDIPFSALDAENDGVVWSYPIWTERSSAAVANGKVYVGSLCYQVSKVPSVDRWENRLYCFDAENGEVLWTFTTEGEVLSSPAVAYGKVYIGDAVGELYCLNAENGGLVWSYYTGTRVLTFSPIIADGKVFMGDHAGADAGDPCYLQCLDAETGELLWGEDEWSIRVKYNTYLGPVEGLSVANGKLYAGTHGHMVVCFGPRSPEPTPETAESINMWPWLIFGGSIVGLLVLLCVLKVRPRFT